MRGHAWGQVAHHLRAGGHDLKVGEQMHVHTRWNDDGLSVRAVDSPGVVPLSDAADFVPSGDLTRQLMFARSRDKGSQDVRAAMKARKEATEAEEAALAARQGEWKREMEAIGSYEEQMKFADAEKKKDAKYEKEMERRRAKRLADSKK